MANFSQVKSTLLPGLCPTDQEVMMDLQQVFRANPKPIEETMGEQGRGLYIPTYQRPYAWQRDNVRSLVSNICAGLTSLQRVTDVFTFIGTLIFIDDKDYATIEPRVRNELPAAVYLIIDGQQRLSTLVMLAIVLHEQLELLSSRRIKSDHVAYEWVQQQRKELTRRLESIFLLDYTYGDDQYQFYPRIIRAYVDCWGNKKKTAKYMSPVAVLIAQYLTRIKGGKSATSEQLEFEYEAPTDVATSTESSTFTESFSVVKKVLKRLFDGRDARNDDDDETLPELSVILQGSDRRLGARFFRQEISDEVAEVLSQVLETKRGAAADIQQFARVAMFCRYFLERVAITEVIVNKEEYAFDMFEALNTTGAPLTAIETFRPRVIHTEKLENYEHSESATHMRKVEAYLEASKDEQREIASHRLLVPFALFDAGEKLSRKPREQRNWLRKQYEACGDIAVRRQFVEGMGNVAQFLQECWPDERAGTITAPCLSEVSLSERNTARLCLSILQKSRHTITVSLLARYYAEILREKPGMRQEQIMAFIQALKALVAFFALWRASRVGTDNIDRVHRNLMSSGDSDLGIKPAHRKSEELLSIEQLHLYLWKQLELKYIHKPDLWVDKAVSIQVYNQSIDLTRLLLLAAFDDAIPDSDNPGLTKNGRIDVSPALTLERWQEDTDIEHIAPKKGDQWKDGQEIYSKGWVDVLGNLTLLPRAENASVSNRSWKYKRFYFQILSSAEANIEALVAEANAQGLDLSVPSQEVLLKARYHKHLAALGSLPQDFAWNVEFIEKRTRHLLERAWNRLTPWLGLQ